MSICSEIQKLLPVSTASVTATDREWVLRHLEECPVCRQIQNELLALDCASSGLAVPDPGPEYWDTFAGRVQQRLAEDRKRSSGNLIRWLVYRPAYGWPAAAAALVLVFFITRAMLPEGEIPDPAPIIQTAPSRTFTSPEVGPESAPTLPGESAENAATAQGGEPAFAEAADNGQLPETVAEDVPPAPTADRRDERAPSYDPHEVPLEELKSVQAARERNLTQADLPERKIIILRGDTAQAELSDKGLPEGRELELAERPNAPFPTDDDTGGGAEAQRVLGTQLGQNYAGFDRSYPALNKDDFTPADREFFEQRIRELTAELARKTADGKQRDLWRELVDMCYQLAINWKDEDDVAAAQDYIAKARDILPEEDYADLDAKAGALKSLLNK